MEVAVCEVLWEEWAINMSVPASFGNLWSEGQQFLLCGVSLGAAVCKERVCAVVQASCEGVSGAVVCRGRACEERAWAPS